MMTAFTLISRNIKLFFKDKGMFFTSLVTPLILLVLYITFLGDAYRDMFVSSLTFDGNLIISDEKMLDGAAAGQLMSSLLAVSCVTVAFCSNMLSVNDKVTGAIRDITVAPVKRSTLAISYFVASLASTLIVCYVATAVCFIYLAVVGWYLSLTDVLLIMLDVLLLSTFGTALASIINHFLTSQGQISAVGTVVSAGYGFICGAYMPISQFGAGLQKALSFFPGTYGTSLMRNHCLGGVFEKMQNNGVPEKAVKALMDAFDCNIYMFDHKVELWQMTVTVAVTCIILLGIYIFMNVLTKKGVKK